MTVNAGRHLLQGAGSQGVEVSGNSWCVGLAEKLTAKGYAIFPVAAEEMRKTREVLGKNRWRDGNTGGGKSERGGGGGDGGVLPMGRGLAAKRDEVVDVVEWARPWPHTDFPGDLFEPGVRDSECPSWQGPPPAGARLWVDAVAFG